ncbi:COG3650 family protein [Pseudoblastomonas halimionae]|uniref:Lipoprotein n=1 Tax=Alteriqipengyuania halimionae TaxID=1926630 RepID=A0A6I4U0W4_9SPHN|nr:hypothetical protein [Alteriqipengyuania halimionae]MXP08583.1 hypothetical protein [Alteriqipengyuania halimionae]
MKAAINLLSAALALAACSGNGPADGDRSAPTFDAIEEGEAVYFTGTEPFWSGEVVEDTVRYATPEDQDGSDVAVSRFAGLGGVSWSGEFDGQAFDLSITEGKCSDGMSDRNYPFVATLSVRGETRRGCAWTDARAFTGAEMP